MIKYLFLLLSFSISAAPKYEVKDIDVVRERNNLNVNVSLSANTKIQFEGEKRDNIVQVELKNTFVWPKIEKKKVVEGFGTVTILAYQFDKNTVRVRAILENEKIISKGLPQFQKTKSGISAKWTLDSVVNENVTKFNEGYLDKLLKDQEERNRKIAKNNQVQDSISFINSANKKQPVIDPLATNQKENKSSSLSGYVIKFFSFLILILGVIYGAVFFLKKGYVAKNKLGFLNNSELIKVLANHHLGPKKSLMVVSAGKQVFLLSSTDQSISMISELNNSTGVFKTGEEILFGNNFDGQMGSTDEKKQEFTIKEDIEKSTPVSLNDSSVITITEKIKNKVKGMKDVQ
ncbi:MAG: flagellar biosynthetic protein FliO [Halobacteriovoraceae bacterium]|nr:flagellar biosynthetic protein FliO [Halobacteriovoraceae bacterium]